MELTLLLGALLILLLMGVPVAFALAGASLLTFIFMDIPPIVGLQRMAAGINTFALMAIPFFVFAGELMYRAGIAQRLVKVAEAMFGRAQGGLGQVTIGASMMFGAVSGSSVASVSAIGSALMPMMRERGYDGDYAVNVTVCAAVLGILIPPSHNMIIYAAAAGSGISIGDLFLAGIVPGIIAGAMLMVAAWLVAKKRGYPRGTFPGWRSLIIGLIVAIPGLMTAVIIVVGILAGVFTPTESSAVAVVYTVIIAGLVYRSMGWKEFAQAAAGAARTTAIIMFIIASAGAFGWLLALLQAPEMLAGLITAASENPIVIFLIINLILLILGTFMDMAPLIIIMTPILLPIAEKAGMDPTQFGMVLLLNLSIGLVTPPVGSVLFLGSAIGKVKVEDTVRSIWPFYLALLAALMLVTFVPFLSMGLPTLMNGN
ncbi:TRAP transporter large permease [Aquisalinus flavus]|uniref:TRAP transporter large permease protein n=1 Tax=Aquisalinus flavus TaxID=1526572 RepID=A0A8J2V129_9PROT|nr:TRAP transporter large permease [Aquisalinus flavus]MBD0427156.1 TRAP transporter large permease [Aquisalinus flavus]UNE46974.1 TRAP transporter large permease [Aquisalinus flavus]GGC98805.1 C4-dicarboxylate ABC transporter permease [Aquisalinus flavus]